MNVRTDPSTVREKHLARAIEFDDLGRLILTDGIAFNSPLAATCPSKLQLGDVLVWYSSNADWKTKAIQEFSQGPFSHVGIYVGKGLSVDAGPAGVSLMAISDLMKNFAYGWVLRKPNLKPMQRSDIVKAAKNNLDRGYAWMDAIALPARRRALYSDMTKTHRWNWLAILGRGLIAWRRRSPPSPNKTFCSRIVIEAFAAIAHLSPEHRIACAYTPFDLAAETFFKPVGWLCKSAPPGWHPFDPYSPQGVTQRKWSFSPMRIWLAK